MAIKLKVQEGGAVKFTVGSADGVKFTAESGIPIYPNYYTGDYEVTPTESEQSFATSGLMMSDDVSVHAVPSDYVGSAIDRRSSTDITASGATVSVPSGYYEENASKSVQSGSVATPTGGITANPTISVDSSGLITASVSKSESISPIVNEGYVTSGTAGTITFSGSATSQLSTQAGKTVTPTESVQTAVGAEKFTTGAVKVGAIPSDYVGSGITQRSSADLSASGDTVTAPSGYYAESASKSVASGSATTPATSITANPTISVDSSTGLISASVSASKSVTPTVSAGYVSNGTSGTVSVSGSNTEQLSTQAGTTITPTTSEQTAVSAGKYTLGDVKVSAMPTGAKNAQVNTWGWTSTTKKLTVTFPNATSGYYTGTQAGAVTPIELYRQTETVTPTESSQEVTPTNGTYYIEKVTVDAIPSNYVGSGVTQRDSTDLSASGATVTAPSGYYAENATKTIASGSATPAASISATGAGKTVGNGTITLTKSAVSNTPQVTAGYISSGTAGNTSVSLTASVTTQAGQTYHPSTTDQSVAANTYVLGAQTFNAVTTTNLTAENIKDGVTIKIGDSTDDDCVTSVTGSYTGGGANLQAKTNIDPTTSSQTITADTGYDGLSSVQINAMPSGTEGTPTATKGTVNNHAISVTPSVTNVAGYISGGTHNGTAVSVSASELVSGTKSITASGNTDVTNYATASVASGGATASATKGTVSNHSITVTPSVTRTAGYITAGSANGTAVTVSASELVSGSETKTANGTYDVTNLAELVVNVSGGGGTDRLVLIQTTAIGALQTSSTSAAGTGKTVSLASTTGWQNYDLLLVDISVDTKTNGRHTSTVTPVILTGTSNVSTKNTYTVGSNKWNSKLGSTGTASTRQSTTAYGVYINAASVSSNTLTLTVYYKYNSNNTGTLNGTYTARVYGINLIDLIGG